MAAAAAAPGWQPHESLTKAPTNLKEAIDWVLRVTGRDGKKNEKNPATPGQLGCLCYLAKAVKDLLYDAKDPGSPGPSPGRNWENILLTEEQSIVKPVLSDLGLLSGESGTVSTTFTNAGGTEVIRTLIDHLALGLQKWVGWEEENKGTDVCCLNTETGIGGKCTCSTSGGANCCSTSGSAGTTCHDCGKCGTSSAGQKCYLSAYCKKTATSGGGSNTEGDYYWPTLSDKADQVHLLARIFLGSVCLIWSGISQLGFLTGGTSGKERWKDKALSSETDGLGSFMAAMGYDLDRLNGSGSKGTGKTGEFVWNLLSGQEPSDEKKKIKWQEFSSVKGANQDSVAEYYSSIYGSAKEKNTEKLCENYPLLVLHILASGYFRAGSAGAKGVTTPAKPASSDPKKDTTHRKPRTIREILYWLSALPYSQGYCQLVGRMQGKMESDTLKLEGDNAGKTPDLHKDKMTHYLMAACGYCPLVLIGIQGTIERDVTQSQPQPALPGGGGVAGADKKKCPNHKEKRHERCNPKDIGKQQAAPQAQSTTGEPLKDGEVCYGGYHLEVSKFGPLHGMYANGLFGFQMDTSPAQCLDQLRVYVYHCFYQLYFLRKQCSTGVDTAGTTVLGWKSCRYGKGVSTTSARLWICQTKGTGNDCQCKKSASPQSPLMAFLCDSLTGLHCPTTTGSSVERYQEIKDHMENKKVVPPGHFGAPPKHCPVPMGWQAESTSTNSGQQIENHFKDLNTGTHKKADLAQPGTGKDTYPVHCTGNTLSHLLEYYCDPEQCQHGSLVVLLRLLACITPTVPRTLGDLFGFYYYIVYIGGNVMWDVSRNPIREALKNTLKNVGLGMLSIYNHENLTGAISKWKGEDGSSSAGCTSGSCKKDTLRCLYGDKTANHCTPFLSPLSGQQYGQLSPAMAGTYLSWLVYLIGEFQGGLGELVKDYRGIDCKDGCKDGAAGGAAAGCGGGQCRAGTHGNRDTCCCTSVVSCTGVLPVLYKYGFGYGNVTELHKTTGGGGAGNKQCHDFLGTLEKVLTGDHLTTGIGASGLHHEINQLIYTTRLPWIFVLTLAWLVAVLYLAFGAIWPLDWTHMRSHCRGWFRKGSLSPWEVLMVGKKKGRGILEFFGKT